MADIVFSQPEEKKWMDSMAHPIIKQKSKAGWQFCAIKELRQQCWMYLCFMRLAGIVWQMRFGWFMSTREPAG